MMLSFVTLLAGCGVVELPELEPVSTVEAEPEERGLEMPTEAPMDGADIASGGAKEPPREPPNPDEVATVAPEDWNPVSVPLGPREGGGVKWEGVSTKPNKGDSLRDLGLTEEDLEKNPSLRPSRPH